MPFSPDMYLRALHFAARAHGEQRMLSGPPYVVHLTSVAMEVSCALRSEPGLDEDLAIACALLHDIVEDTSTTLDDVAHEFGPAVAAGVQALTRNAALPEANQIRDSLDRVQRQPREVAIVKLADRITNTASPPPMWTEERIATYRREAQDILEALGSASALLAERLRLRIQNFGKRS